MMTYRLSAPSACGCGRPSNPHPQDENRQPDEPPPPPPPPYRRQFG